MGINQRLENHLRRRLRRKQKYKVSRSISGVADLKKLEYLINLLDHAGFIFGDDTLNSSLQYLNAQEKKALVKACIDRAKKLGIDKNRLFNEYEEGSESSGESIKGAFRNENFKKLIYKHIMDGLYSLFYKSGKKNINGSLKKKLSQVGKVFDLSFSEKEILFFYYLRGSDNMVDSIFDEFCTCIGIKNSVRNYTTNPRPISAITGLPRPEVCRSISDSSTLSRSGLINKDNEPAVEVVEYLQGNARVPITKKYFSEFSGTALPLQSHTIDKKHISTVKALKEHKTRGQGINILLYGMPGTGKTEFARSLGRNLGLAVYEISNLAAEGDSDKEVSLDIFRYRSLLACQRMVNQDRSLIIVDEADSLLNSEPAFFSMSPVSEKGQINRLLDDSSAFIIWITNRYDGINDSTKRRFDYSIGFDKLTFMQRKTIWHTSLKKHRLVRCLSREDIDRLASDYEVSAGGIDIALRNASRIHRRKKSRGGVMDIIDSIMKAHLKILDQKENKDFKKANAPEYSLEGLNIKGDTEQTIALIDRFNVYWGLFDDDMEEVRNMNLLLYGPPGTGKTEFAKYIARRINRRLIIRRASDLISCWVGETEKLIHRAFAEAEKDKAVLFIDEADSFLGSRENAVRSWEISQVNELLTNMETFKGMLICATNFKQIVDSAAIRRFNIKLEFDYLKPEGNIIFYKMFTSRLLKTPLSQTESAEIGARSYLTPGDFKVVYQKYSFFDEEKLSHRELIAALKQEVACKGDNLGKKIGFGKE